MSKTIESVLTPKGRLVNGSLFEKDVYKDEKGREGTPCYKIEMAFDEDDESLSAFEDAIVAAAVETWGKGAEEDYDEGRIRSPLLDGNVLAEKREKKGKSGDAYRGKLVIRASTIFNKHGEDAPGGVYVADKDANELTFEARGKIYNGSYGVAVVKPQTYELDGRKGVTLYLGGYQFVEDGEPLRGQNVAAMFKPLNAPAEGESRGRRGRRAK